MDIDPIDGGPKEIVKPVPATNSTLGNVVANSSGLIPMQVSEEEEARQAIDMLRGDDVAARVAAASRLESVASVLGEQRTRDVRNCNSLKRGIVTRGEKDPGRCIFSTCFVWLVLTLPLVLYPFIGTAPISD